MPDDDAHRNGPPRQLAPPAQGTGDAAGARPRPGRWCLAAAVATALAVGTGTGPLRATAAPPAVLAGPARPVPPAGPRAAAQGPGRGETTLLEVHLDVPASRPDEGLGRAIAGLGDQDGDDVPDLLVGAPQLTVGPGEARVLSGADGRLLATVSGAVVGEAFGATVAALDDLNGDGVRDFAVGSPRDDTGALDGGAVRIVSGRTAEPLYTASSKADDPVPVTIFGDVDHGRLGTSLAAAGDIDGDGLGELLVGAPSAPHQGWSPGRVLVVSARRGRLLHEWSGDDRDELFGHAVAGLDDLDGDGSADVAVAAPRARREDGRALGRVVLLSGSDGRVLREIVGPEPARFGWSLAAVGDMDGDGLGDLLVGAPDGSRTGPGAGSAHLIATGSGRTLHVLHGEQAHDHLGFAVAAAGDVDGDGRIDLAIGAHDNDHGGWGAGQVLLLSGASGDLLASLEGERPSLGLGYALAPAGDVDGDGRNDLVVGLGGRHGLRVVGLAGRAAPGR